jgi:hypothetical protein
MAYFFMSSVRQHSGILWNVKGDYARGYRTKRTWCIAIAADTGGRAMHVYEVRLLDGGLYQVDWGEIKEIRIWGIIDR